jgi:beta-galactosidase GanA
MRTHEQRLDFMMLHDFLRSVDKNYFIHEIYPGLGMFKYKYDTPFDMDFKTYTSLAGGAKGIVYWQYRAERLGHEQDCAGLVRMDGSPRDVVYAVRDFGADLKKNMKYLSGAEVKTADVAIVFDFNSMLMSEIEDVCGPDFSFDWANPQFYYRNAHAGMYRLLRNSDYAVDYVGASRPEEFAKYKVLYFPYYTMLDPKIVPYIEEFVKNGGTVISDEGFGMRQMNTWMQPYDIDCKSLFTSRLEERRFVAEDFAEIDGELVRIRPYRTHYRHEGGETVATWLDGSSAAQKFEVGKGRIYLLGFSSGYSYYDTNDSRLASFIDKIVSSAGAEKNKLSDTLGGIYEKRLVNGKYEVIHLFNNTEEEKYFELDGEIVAVGGHGSVRESKAIVPANSMAYFVIEKK